MYWCSTPNPQLAVEAEDELSCLQKAVSIPRAPEVSAVVSSGLVGVSHQWSMVCRSKASGVLR